VGKGQAIGLSGNTGKSTGPHLHFEIKLNGVRRNPFIYLK
jgi:murein DD-endopeptidase MepM/ murein hydrolase activator NlpD